MRRLATALALLLAGCGSAPLPATIRVGAHLPLSGPASRGDGALAPAIAAYFRYLNARGGVDGRRVAFVYRDDAGDAEQGLGAARRLVTGDRVVAVIGSAGPVADARAYLRAAGVPDILPARPDPALDGRVLGERLRGVHGARVGVIYEADAYGRAGLAGLRAALAPGQLVSTEPYATTDTDLDAQIAGIRAANANWLVDFTIPAYTALSVLSAERAGWHPRLAVAAAGADPPAVVGVLRELGGGPSLPAGALTTAVPASEIRLFRRIRARYLPRAPFDATLIAGMSVGRRFELALRAAGASPTPAALARAAARLATPAPVVVGLQWRPW